MFKSLAKTVFVLTLLCLVNIYAVLAAPDEAVKIVVNNNEIAFDVNAFILNGTVYAPVRPVAEALGLTVLWDEAEKQVMIYPVNDNWYKFSSIPYDTLNQAENYSKTETQPIAVMLDGNVFVPVRFISEKLEASVNWDEKSRTVFIENNLINSLLSGKSADTAYTLMEGRLNLKMPAGSIILNGSNGNRLGYSKEKDETVIMLEENLQQLELSANELFHTTTGDLLADAKYYINNPIRNRTSTHFNFEGPIKSGDLEYVIISPDLTDKSSTDIKRLFKGALVKTTDNTLIFIGMSVNMGLPSHIDDCNRIWNEIIGSMTQGERLIEDNKDTVVANGKTIMLPDGYVSSFSFYIDAGGTTIYKIVPLGEAQPFLSMLEGHYSPYNGKLSVKIEEAAYLGNRKATWSIFCNEAGVFDAETHCEILIEGDITSELYVCKPITKENWDIMKNMLK